MRDTEFINGLKIALNSPNFIERRKQVMVDCYGAIGSGKSFWPKKKEGKEMFTHRYIVLGITEKGYVDRLCGLRGTDPNEICERALEKVAREGKREVYRQLILISIGKEGKLSESLQVNLYRIEPTPPTPQPTFTLHPVHAYFG